MNTYLFIWNPKYWTWDNLLKNIDLVNKGGTYIEDWSCGVTKTISPGSRFFLIKLGTEVKKSSTNPKGIMGSGYIVSEPYYKKGVKEPDKATLHVDLKFDDLLNPYIKNILTLGILQTGNLLAQHWTSQSSGILIKPNIVDELEALWFDLISPMRIKNSPSYSKELENNKIFNEGSSIQIELTRYERNQYARKICIEHWGYTCCVCQFNFEETYGTIGRNFIHVHHLNQIATIGKEYQIDPKEDLRPVCPNCHAMLHRRIPALSIEELKSLLRNN